MSFQHNVIVLFQVLALVILFAILPYSQSAATPTPQPLTATPAATSIQPSPTPSFTNTPIASTVTPIAGPLLGGLTTEAAKDVSSQ